MSITIHIPFYNLNPEEKQGFRKLRRIDFLKENISNLKKLSIRPDIFVHTHNDYLDDKDIEAEIVHHKISNEDLEKGYLTWLIRPEIEKQKNKYQYFMFLEHDIRFTEKNFQYYLKYQKSLSYKKFNLGFLIYENSNEDNQKYSIHLTKKLGNFININSQNFFINDLENYCCSWIYDQKQFNDFLGTKWWSFQKRAHNFRHNYGIVERSSIGYNALNMEYFRATLIPEIDKKPDPGCLLEHMTNNYYNKFSEFKGQNFTDIRGVCKFKVDEIFEVNNNNKKQF